jgi:nucleotide-binding universal stress UspA family protein
MYTKILVAYNGTPESRSALHECVRLAPPPGAQVHLLCVVHSPSPLLLAGEYVPEEALDVDREKMQRELKDGHTFLARAGLNVTDHLAAGEPVDVISQLATDLAVELIIVGHRRTKSFAQRWWRGKVDALLIERVHCSILVAQEPARPS